MRSSYDNIVIHTRLFILFRSIFYLDTHTYTHINIYVYNNACVCIFCRGYTANSMPVFSGPVITRLPNSALYTRVCVCVYRYIYDMTVLRYAVWRPHNSCEIHINTTAIAVVQICGHNNICPVNNVRKNIKYFLFHLSFSFYVVHISSFFHLIPSSSTASPFLPSPTPPSLYHHHHYSGHFTLTSTMKYNNWPVSRWTAANRFCWLAGVETDSRGPLTVLALRMLARPTPTFRAPT